jgi:flavin-binding protein dodecin
VRGPLPAERAKDLTRRRMLARNIVLFRARSLKRILQAGRVLVGTSHGAEELIPTYFIKFGEERMKTFSAGSVQEIPRKIAKITGRDGRVDVSANIEPLHLAPASQTDAHTYRVIEVVGASDRSIDEAIKSAIERAHQTIRHLRWFEVARTSGHIGDGKVNHFQVTLKVGFTMEGAPTTKPRLSKSTAK